jgi:predicted acetyltransferase
MECTFAQTREHEREYAEVSAKAFRWDGDFLEHKLTWFKRPGYIPEHTRLVVDEGKVVAGVAIVELPVRYGDATLKLGGISCVATDPKRQKRGYGRANMEDTVRYMSEADYDISFLLGIHGYYSKYGYRTALMWSWIDLDLVNAYTAMPKGWRSRRMQRKDIPGMTEAYRNTIGQCNLSVQRSDADWNWYFRFKRMGRKTDHVILNESGKVMGYFCAKVSGAGLRVAELAVADDVSAYECIVAALHDCAKANYGRKADIYTAPDGGFARWCLYRKCAQLTQKTDFEGGPMFRLFNVERLFGKISGSLTERWNNAPRSVPAETVTLSCPMGQVALVPENDTLAVKPGEAVGEVVKISDEALTELVLGFRSAPDVLRGDNADVTDAAIQILSALFPTQIPFIPPTDHM